MKRLILSMLAILAVVLPLRAQTDTSTSEKRTSFLGLLRVSTARSAYGTRCVILQQVLPSYPAVAVGAAVPASDPAVVAMLNNVNQGQQRVADLLQQVLLKQPQADPALMALLNGFMAKQDSIVAAIQSGNQANLMGMQQLASSFATSQQALIAALANHTAAPPVQPSPIIVNPPVTQPSPTPQPIVVVPPTVPATGIIQTIPSGGSIQALPDGGILQKLPGGGVIQTLPSGGVLQQLPGLPPSVIVPPPKDVIIQQVPGGGTTAPVPGGGTTAPVPGGGTISPVPGSNSPMQGLPKTDGAFKPTTVKTTYPSLPISRK